MLKATPKHPFSNALFISFQKSQPLLCKANMATSVHVRPKDGPIPKLVKRNHWEEPVRRIWYNIKWSKIIRNLFFLTENKYIIKVYQYVISNGKGEWLHREQVRIHPHLFLFSSGSKQCRRTKLLTLQARWAFLPNAA